MTTYRTKQGDMWDSIAYNELGSTLYTDDLMALNPQYLLYYIFPAGIELVLPEPDENVSAAAVPWKQVAG